MANLEYIKGTTGDLETSALWLTDEERKGLHDFLAFGGVIQTDDLENIIKALEEEGDV